MATDKLNKKIGIMGGTFDPPHNGHLLSAIFSQKALLLDKVIFIPTGKKVYKPGVTSVTDKQRLDMVSSMIKDYPKFCVSCMEVNNTKVNYTADTLKELSEEYKGSELFFIVGADSLDYMEKWYRPDIIFKLCTVVAINRRGFSYEHVQKKIESLSENFNAKIICVDIPDTDVSSTDIRGRLSNGEDIDNMVPSGVLSYIKENNLYIKS